MDYKFKDLKKKLQKIGIIFILLLLILGGLKVLIIGEMGNPSASNSFYEFSGIERLMGLLPIIFGVLLIYLIISGKSNMD